MLLWRQYSFPVPTFEIVFYSWRPRSRQDTLWCFSSTCRGQVGQWRAFTTEIVGVVYAPSSVKRNCKKLGCSTVVFDSHQWNWITYLHLIVNIIIICHTCLSDTLSGLCFLVSIKYWHLLHVCPCLLVLQIYREKIALMVFCREH